MRMTTLTDQCRPVATFGAVRNGQIQESDTRPYVFYD